MKHNDNVLQLFPEGLPAGPTLSTAVRKRRILTDGILVGKITKKIDELQAKKAALETDCKEIVPQGTKLFNYFEQKCLNKQIELLNWLIGEK